MLEFNIPDEDTLHAKPKEVSWTKKYLKLLDNEIDVLAKVVKKNIDMKKIKMMLS